MKKNLESKKYMLQIPKQEINLKIKQALWSWYSVKTALLLERKMQARVPSFPRVIGAK